MLEHPKNVRAMAKKQATSTKKKKKKKKKGKGQEDQEDKEGEVLSFCISKACNVIFVYFLLLKEILFYVKVHVFGHHAARGAADEDRRFDRLWLWSVQNEKKMQPATSLKNQLMYCKINLKSLYWSLM